MDETCYQVTLEGYGVCFPVRAGERILGAARRAGVSLPFECGWGSCSSCKATLVDGSVELLFAGAPALDARDERRRRILLCQTAPTSDVVIKPQRVDAGPSAERPTRDHAAVLEHAEVLAPDIARFTFAVTDASGGSRDVEYRCGQYAVLELAPGLRRCYSLAGLPGGDRVEFIAKRYPAGAGSQRLFELVPGESITIEMPYGDMWLRPSARPVLLAAGGTGISAILALLRSVVEDPAERSRRVRVVYGAATYADLVCWDELVDLVAALPDATLHGALVAPEIEWRGTHGFVTHALQEMAGSGEHEDLADSDAYLAGPPVMVQAVKESFGELGIPLDRTFVDSFG